MTLRLTAVQPSAPDLVMGRVIRLLRRLPPLFLGIVVAPTIIACLYYLFIASPIYISQAQFVVRAASAPQAPTGLGAVLQGVGLGPAETDSFAVQDYIMSRDAISSLETHERLRGARLRLPFAFPSPVRTAFVRESRAGLSAVRQRHLQLLNRDQHAAGQSVSATGRAADRLGAAGRERKDRQPPERAGRSGCGGGDPDGNRRG